MIAEIHGKISSNGTNLKETLEDELTGNIFETIRYMSFNKGLKRILMHGIYPRQISEVINKADCECFKDNIEFWPYDEEGEIDLLLNLENIIIGIEVKYTSSLSSDDSVQGHEENNKSYNQLARQSRIISKKGAGKEKILLFTAPDRECSEVYNSVKKRDILEDDVLFGYVSWESILECLTILTRCAIY